MQKQCVPQPSDIVHVPQYSITVAGDSLKQCKFHNIIASLVTFDCINLAITTAVCTSVGMVQSSVLHAA